MVGSGVYVAGELSVLEAVLATLRMHVRAGLRYPGVYELANEGIDQLRRSLGLPAGPDAPPEPQAAGVFWGDPRGWIVVNLRLLTEGVVGGALAGNRGALRRFARGLATLDEALRWHADLIDEADRRHGEMTR